MKPATRAMAAAMAVQTVYSLVAWFYRRGLHQQLQDGDDFEALIEKLETIGLVGLAFHVAVYLVLILVAASMVRHLEGGPRRLVQLAVGGFILHLVIAAPLWVLPYVDQHELAYELRHLHVLSDGLSIAGLVVLLHAVRPPRAMWVGYTVLAAAWVVFDLLINVAEPEFIAGTPAWTWPAITTTLGVVWIIGMVLAGPVDTQATRTRTDDAKRLEAAAGLRLFRIGLLARVAVGALFAVALVATLASGNMAAASGVVWLGFMVSLAAAVTMGFGLVKTMVLPPDGQISTFITLALVGLFVGVGLDLVSTTASTRLFDLAAEAETATSMWATPSMSDVESLQAQMQWGGRLATVLGIGAALAVCLSVRRTAWWIECADSRRRADHVATLTVIAGAAALGLSLTVQSGEIRDTALLVILAMIGLALGIWLLASWSSLLGGLADALEAGPEA